jgi:uncharacterized membrane protein
MLADFLIGFQWWSVLFIISIIFTPLTYYLFPNFIDRGYIFSKSIGILIVSYVMLVVGIVHILPFSFFSLVLILVLCAVFSIFAAKKYRFWLPLIKDLKPLSKWIIIEEIFFLIIFIFFSYVRSFAPDINGLEKFMDYGFVNSILRSTYFPPKDMWFTPLSINYYYFGHFITAVLTKLSLLSSNYTFNLMIATIAGLTFVSSFSIGVNLFQKITEKVKFLKIVIVGILSGLLVTFAGNLHVLYTLFLPYENEHPVPFWQLVFSPHTFPNSYWYPNATRFIYHTIHEFPIYSWTVSDLHGHVTDIPFVLLTIAFLFSFFLGYKRVSNAKRVHKKRRFFSSYYEVIIRELHLSLPQIAILSLLLAIMYMTNAWDGLIYYLLAILLIAYLNWMRLSLLKLFLIQKLLNFGAGLIIPGIVLGLGLFIFSLPLSFFFKPFVSGVGILCAPSFLTKLGHIGPFLFEPNHCQRSPWWQLLTLYGFFYFFIILLGAAFLKIKRLTKSDIFVTMLILTSTLLIIIPEFIYAKDIYPDHYRANTMFKLVFQSFIMLSLVTGYTISRISHALKIKKTLLTRITYIIFFFTTLCLLTSVFSYPYFAIMSYYGDLKTYHGLNGTQYLKQKYPSDAKAIEWLNKNVSGQPVILEAQGDSYTDYARVSSNTGLPTVLGWTVHEWLWRGTYDIPAPRIDEVKALYESEDITKTKSLLHKYNVKYIFIGTLEREKYTIDEDKFEKLGKVAFENGTTRIYQIF